MRSLRSFTARATRGVQRAWEKYAGPEASWRREGDQSPETSHLADLTLPLASERWRAAASLGRNPLQSREAVAALIHALGDPEQFVRWHAAEALARQEQGHVFPFLVDALHDESALRRAAAAEALGKHGGEGAAVTLIRHIGDPDCTVRMAVAEALGELKEPASTPALLSLLQDEDSDVVRAAAGALGRIGDPAAAPLLAEALAKPRQPVLVRRALAAALVRAGRPDAQPQLLAALRDEDPQVRAYAAQALGNVGTEAAIAPLSQLKNDKSRLIRGTVNERAAQAIELLERRGRRAGLQPGGTDRDVREG